MTKSVTPLIAFLVGVSMAFSLVEAEETALGGAGGRFGQRRRLRLQDYVKAEAAWRMPAMVGYSIMCKTA